MLLVLALIPARARAQQTLGAINGTVTDQSGAVVQDVGVKIRNVGTNLAVNAKTKDDGSFSVVDLPIGTYEVTFSKEGFRKEVYSQILVQGNRTTSVNAKVSPGALSSTVTVNATPLLNETDVSNGYTLGTEVLENTPLGTGSFTQLAILAPGVSADLLSGSGTNSGLGNQDITANGQRYTSNSFSINSIASDNLFNGNSSSQVSANRLVFNTGESFQGGGLIFTATSVFDAVGEALPSPPPETIQELHVNTSMYDASQGANSGAHIELTTKSGTNDYHGGAYEYHQTTGWDANPYFFNQNGIARQPLHRNMFGGLVGGPVIHDKMFFFASYQGQRVADHLNGISNVPVPPDLTDDRSPQGLANLVNTDFIGPCGGAMQPACFNPNSIDPVAQAMLCAPLPAPCAGKSAPPGGFFIPSANNASAFANAAGYEATLQGSSSRFTADQVNGNVDYDFGTKDRLAVKYYYQRDPTTNPFAESSLVGFPQSLNAGSQVVSIDNTRQLSPNFTWEQRMGFIREKAFSNTAQPSGFTPTAFGLNLFGAPKFPSITITTGDTTNCNLLDPTGNNPNSCFDPLTVGPLDNFANAGFFQNNFEWASSANWVHGIHTLSFGFNFDYTQLNIENQNNQVAFLTFNNFPDFLQGLVQAGVGKSTFFNGASSRHYRAKQSGLYVQDNIKLRSNLSLSAGLRWDWDGPLTETHGLLDNFSPGTYSYDLTSDTINNIGLVVAGNNSQFCGTKSSSCASDSTLTGRQWGLEPRIGLVWSPGFVKNLVVRAGFGMYVDRGEFFTEFSPSAGSGFSGPFGVTLDPPFVLDIPSTCASNTDCFANPFGTTAPGAPPSNLSQIAALVPCQGLNASGACSNPQANGLTSSGLIQGATPFLFGGYNPANKIPYSENWTVDLQWQPWNTLLFDVGYVGNHGLHQLLPIPFNQPLLASPNNMVNGQQYSFGFNVPGIPQEDPSLGGIFTFDGGNTDLRTPYLGYSPNSVFWQAEGISHYNALQLGVNKRLSHGLTITGSYTWSHALDEGSGLSEGLFYNGNNPSQPRTGYGNAAFDRTHVLIVSYVYQFPDAIKTNDLASKFVNGWGISGVTVAQSGQPYSVSDFSGSVGGIYYGQFDNITNPLVPLAPGKTVGDAILQGTTGVNANNPVLNKGAFGVTQLIIPPNSASNPNSPVPPCSSASGTLTCDNVEIGFGNIGRDIFRGPFQTQWNFGVFKNIKLGERFTLRYDAQFFNLFNHPTFDTPNNNVSFNSAFCNPPTTSFANCPSNGGTGPFGFATVPSGNLGVITHTIGSPRFIQMALHLTF